MLFWSFSRLGGNGVPSDSVTLTFIDRRISDKEVKSGEAGIVNITYKNEELINQIQI